MRCITAICPAGPPKLSAATLAQTPTASRNGMPCADVSAFSVAAVAATWAFVMRSISLDRVEWLLLAAVFHTDVVVVLAGGTGIVGHAALAVVAAFFASIGACRGSACVRARAAHNADSKHRSNRQSHRRTLGGEEPLICARRVLGRD